MSAFTLASTGAPATPTTVTLRVRDPADVETDYTAGFVNTMTGVYSFLLTPAISGVWRYQWLGTGEVVAAGERQFEIKPSDFS